MAYCTSSDIQADFKKIDITSTSLITTTAVTQFILEAGALINANVGSRYATPITADSDSLALMSLLCRTLVSERIRGILANKQVTNVDADSAVRDGSGLTTRDVMRILKEIKEGTMTLSGATLNNTNASFFSNNENSNIQPVFRKAVRQW